MWARAAADLVIGAACSGCGRGGYIICSRCRHDLRPGPRQVTLTPAPDELTIPVWAAGPYRSPLRGALVDFKEHGKFSLLDILAHVMAAAVAAAAAANPSVTLVPVPSRPLMRVRRGYDVVAELASGAAAVLRDTGLDARVLPGLSLARAVRDQGSLTGRQRRRNIDGAMRARRHLRAEPTIIVDDIVTTGSTAAEAVRASRDVGVQPVAIATIATPAQQWHRRADPEPDGISGSNGR